MDSSQNIVDDAQKSLKKQTISKQRLNSCQCSSKLISSLVKNGKKLCEYLGAFLDNNVRWSEHVKIVLKDTIFINKFF